MEGFGGQEALHAHGHCFYPRIYPNTDIKVADCGTRMVTIGDWGSEMGEGDRIGMLLDLDQGSMTVYKNDERLGALASSGLSGEYCWAVSLEIEGDNARIEPAALPPTA